MGVSAYLSLIGREGGGRLFEVGAYSNKYGICIHLLPLQNFGGISTI